MIRTLIVIFLILSALAIILYSRAQRPGNLLKPTSNMGAWQWYQGGGANGGVAQEGDALRCTILNVIPNPAALQLYQVGATIENGRTYRIKFSAKSDKDRVIGVDSSFNHAPNTNVGLKVPVPLTKEWQPFQYVFVGENADGLNDRLPTFVVGQSPGTVWVKDVVLEVIK